MINYNLILCWLEFVLQDGFSVILIFLPMHGYPFCFLPASSLLNCL
jgi:hypothetical protein